MKSIVRTFIPVEISDSLTEWARSFRSLDGIRVARCTVSFSCVYRVRVTDDASLVHIKVYPEGSVAKNGTFVPHGSAVHTGQFFYDNKTLNAVAKTCSST